MLNITITPGCLYFKHLNNEMYNELTKKYNIQVEEGAYYIEGRPEQLYKVLLKLSYDYDIELN